MGEFLHFSTVLTRNCYEKTSLVVSFCFRVSDFAKSSEILFGGSYGGLFDAIVREVAMFWRDGSLWVLFGGSAFCYGLVLLGDGSPSC